MPRVQIEVVANGLGVKNIQTLRKEKIPQKPGVMMTIGRGRLQMRLVVMESKKYDTSSTHWLIRLAGSGDDVTKLRDIGWQTFIHERKH